MSWARCRHTKSCSVQARLQEWALQPLPLDVAYFLEAILVGRHIVQCELCGICVVRAGLEPPAATAAEAAGAAVL
jgi:hypothetical protein